MNPVPAGFTFAETDVVASKDGILVLHHDENVARIALLRDGNEEFNKKNIDELSIQQILSTPTKGGEAPPLLTDVLQRARYLSSFSSTSNDIKKLVIELKYGDPAEMNGKTFQDGVAYRSIVTMSEVFVRYFDTTNPDTNKSNAGETVSFTKNDLRPVSRREQVVLC